MFLSPVLVKSESTQGKSEKTGASKQNYQANFCVSHFSSPLSSITATMKMITNQVNPIITTPQRTFSGMRICPKTAAANINLPMSYRAFDKPLRWFLFTINIIISQIKNFVKSIKHEFTRIISRIYPNCQFSSLPPIFAFICGHLRVLTFSALICVSLSAAISVAQEVDVKTKIKELKDKDPKVRISAIQSLGKVQTEEVVRALTDAYKKEKDAYLRMQMVDSLSVNQSTAALTGVIFALDDSNPQVRQSAVIALGYYGDNEKIATALSLLFDKEKEEAVKFSIVNTLGQQKNKSAVSGLGKGLGKNNDKRMRLFAVGNLEKVQTKESLTELEKNKEDPDPEIKEKVKKVLEKKK